MRARNTRRREGFFISILPLLLAPLFAYANLMCVACGATHPECAGKGAGCEAEAAHHHEGSPQQQNNNCARETCFCLTMNTVVAQQSIVKPGQVNSWHVLDFAFAEVPRDLPVVVAVSYEHGPPTIAPPIYLSAKAASPRSPPNFA